MSCLNLLPIQFGEVVHITRFECAGVLVTRIVFTIGEDPETGINSLL